MTQTLTCKNKLQQLRDMITDGKFTAIDALVIIDSPEETEENQGTNLLKEFKKDLQTISDKWTSIEKINKLSRNTSATICDALLNIDEIIDGDLENY